MIAVIAGAFGFVGIVAKTVWLVVLGTHLGKFGEGAAWFVFIRPRDWWWWFAVSYFVSVIGLDTMRAVTWWAR